MQCRVRYEMDRKSCNYSSRHAYKSYIYSIIDLCINKSLLYFESVIILMFIYTHIDKIIPVD